MLLEISSAEEQWWLRVPVHPHGGIPIEGPAIQFVFMPLCKTMQAGYGDLWWRTGCVGEVWVGIKSKEYT